MCRNDVMCGAHTSQQVCVRHGASDRTTPAGQYIWLCSAVQHSNADEDISFCKNVVVKVSTE